MTLTTFPSDMEPDEDDNKPNSDPQLEPPIIPPDKMVLDQMTELLTPRLTKYIPHVPTPRQTAFLLLDNVLEAFYGGAVGGGKSDALLMAALQYVDVPDYSALILRRTYGELAMPGAIMDRSHQWLGNTDARWRANEKTWEFPSGARLVFGYLELEKDRYRYDGAEFQFIGIDELTQFLESQYTYMFTRARRRKGLDVPLRIRSASNPGGVGHDWVKHRFIDPQERARTGRVFIPAKIADNPHISGDEYIRSLEMSLDTHTKAQKLDGNWDALPDGDKFERHWFEVVDYTPDPQGAIRVWDLAGTKPSAQYKDPDWTRGIKGFVHEGILYVTDLVSLRDTSAQVKALVKNTATQDGPLVKIHIPRDPGAAGKHVVDEYKRALEGYLVKDMPVAGRGSKWDRATPVSSAAENGRVKLLRASWNDALLDELCAFKQDNSHAHDDIVDVLSDLYNELISRKTAKHESDTEWMF